jgi:hypothetical protein
MDSGYEGSSPLFAFTALIIGYIKHNIAIRANPNNPSPNNNIKGIQIIA